MNKLGTLILPAARRLCCKVLGKPKPEALQRETDPSKASPLIYNLLMRDDPCMVARFGATELSCIVNYLGIKAEHHSLWRYIRGRQAEWWWRKSTLEQMQKWSGFFPPTEENAARFSEMMLQDCKELDLLVAWAPDTVRLKPHLPEVPWTGLIAAEPYWADKPWTAALAGKKVLVVHPFAPLIEKQYREHRSSLFEDPNVLPAFTLSTIKAVQSVGGEPDAPVADWFEALDLMKRQMDAIDYDIALLGCGAYGFPLAAHAKRTGHKVVHLGGSLQILFGIKGKRWDDPKHGAGPFIPEGGYQRMFNEHWVWPDDSLRPAHAGDVEGGTYWK